MYDFDHSNRQIEIIKHAIMRYACDAEVNVTTVDTNAVDFGISRDSTSKDSEPVSYNHLDVYKRQRQ